MRRYAGVGVTSVLLMANVLVAPVRAATNSPPVAVDDPSQACGNGRFGGSFPIPEDWNDWFVLSGTCAPMANDWDPDGDPLTFGLVGQPQHGEAISLPDGFLAYRVEPDYSTPPGDVPGGSWISDLIQYRISDGALFSDPANYRLWIAPINDPPSFTPGPTTIRTRALGGPVALQWATDIIAGPPNESGQVVAFQVPSNPSETPGMFVTRPSIDASGLLTFEPGSEPGAATFWVTAKDNGGMEDHGLGSHPAFTPPSDTSDPVLLRITIDPPVTIPIATLTAPRSPTNGSTLTYEVDFGEPVSGLTASDFSVAGTAAGCAIDAPELHGSRYRVAVASCSEGTVTLTLAADSVVAGAADVGPATPVSADPVLIDRTAPTMAPPAAPTIARPQTAGASAAELSVSWSAADEASGVADHEVERSVAYGAWSPLASTSATSLRSSADYGSAVRYRVRARDHAGNVSRWATTPTVIPRLTDQADAAVVYAGSWAAVTASAYLGGSTRYSTMVGATATFRSTSRAIAWVSARGPTMGAANLYVDGRLSEVVNLYSSSVSRRDVVFTTSWPATTIHTITIEVAGTGGPTRVDLDGWIRLSSFDPPRRQGPIR